MANKWRFLLVFLFVAGCDLHSKKAFAHPAPDDDEVVEYTLPTELRSRGIRVWEFHPRASPGYVCVAVSTPFEGGGVSCFLPEWNDG